MNKMRNWQIVYDYGQEKYKKIHLDARNVIKAVETLARIQYDKSKLLFVRSVIHAGEVK
jgi:hypothetical protein